MPTLQNILNTPAREFGKVSIPLRESWRCEDTRYCAKRLMGRVGVLLLPSPRKNRTSKLSKHPALANPPASPKTQYIIWLKMYLLMAVVMQ